MNSLLNLISIFFVSSGIVVALFLAYEVRRNKQLMKIMNPVWILTGLWGHFIALAAYMRLGREKKDPMCNDMKMNMPMDDTKTMGMAMGKESSRWKSVALSTLHCGAGCTLADIIGEGFTYFIPMGIWSGWILDFVLALIIGIYFQYFAIREMENISSGSALLKAFKADILSLTSWQIGMYSWMWVTYFILFKDIDKGSWVFWFMMQIAMLFGFFFAYPMNALLIKWGIKKGM